MREEYERHVGKRLRVHAYDVYVVNDLHTVSGVDVLAVVLPGAPDYLLLRWNDHVHCDPVWPVRLPSGEEAYVYGSTHTTRGEVEPCGEWELVDKVGAGESNA